MKGAKLYRRAPRALFIEQTLVSAVTSHADHRDVLCSLHMKRKKTPTQHSGLSHTRHCRAARRESNTHFAIRVGANTTAASHRTNNNSSTLCKRSVRTRVARAATGMIGSQPSFAHSLIGISINPKSHPRSTVHARQRHSNNCNAM